MPVNAIEFGVRGTAGGVFGGGDDGDAGTIIAIGGTEEAMISDNIYGKHDGRTTETSKKKWKTKIKHPQDFEFLDLGPLSACGHPQSYLI